MIGHRTAALRRDAGFTLVELLVVIVVLGILASVATPIYLGQQRSARDASVVLDVRNTSAGAVEWVLNNRGSAVTNTADFTSAGGRVTKSGANVIDVTVSSAGDFTVCGYSTDGGSYDSSTNAYLQTSQTGQGARSTAGCPGNGVAGTPGSGATPSTSTGGGTAPGTAPSTGGGGTSTGTGSTPSASASAASPSASTTPTPTPTPTPVPQWIDCAGENETCTFSGTHDVRYGIGPSSYVVMTLTNGTPCTNGVFGDPAYGYVKRCEYLQ